MVHEAPDVYSRYTSLVLGHLYEANSLKVIKVRSVGGLLPLIGQVVTLGWPTLVGAISGSFWPARLSNNVCFVRGVDILDCLLGAQAILPSDHFFVALHA